VEWFPGFSRRSAPSPLHRVPSLDGFGLPSQPAKDCTGPPLIHRIDLTEPTADGRIAEILERERVEAFVHAAFRNEPTPDLETDHEVETIGSLHVMHACAAAKVRRLLSDAFDGAPAPA